MPATQRPLDGPVEPSRMASVGAALRGRHCVMPGCRPGARDHKSRPSGLSLRARTQGSQTTIQAFRHSRDPLPSSPPGVPGRTGTVLSSTRWTILWGQYLRGLHRQASRPGPMCSQCCVLQMFHGARGVAESDGARFQVIRNRTNVAPSPTCISPCSWP